MTVFCLFVVLFLYLFCFVFVVVVLTPPHEEPHAVFGGFISLSGGWMLLRKKLIVAEDSSHINMQRIKHFNVAFEWGFFLGNVNF